MGGRISARLNDMSELTPHSEILAFLEQKYSPQNGERIGQSFVEFQIEILANNIKNPEAILRSHLLQGLKGFLVDANTADTKLPHIKSDASQRWIKKGDISDEASTITNLPPQQRDKFFSLYHNYSLFKVRGAGIELLRNQNPIGLPVLVSSGSTNRDELHLLYEESINPDNRPLIQNVLDLAEQKLSGGTIYYPRFKQSTFDVRVKIAPDTQKPEIIQNYRANTQILEMGDYTNLQLAEYMLRTK